MRDKMLALGVLVCVLVTRIRSNHLQALPAMPALHPMPPLSRLSSALKRMKPGSDVFLPMLELFLRSKKERKLLEQLEGLAAVHAADVLEKVPGRTSLLVKMRLTLP